MILAAVNDDNHALLSLRAFTSCRQRMCVVILIRGIDFQNQLASQDETSTRFALVLFFTPYRSTLHNTVSLGPSVHQQRVTNMVCLSVPSLQHINCIIICDIVTNRILEIGKT